VTSAEADAWAFALVNQTVIASDPIRAWNLTLALINAAPDDLLGYVGAGPLEDTIDIHGATLIDKIEERAAQDRRFRFCLGGIYLAAGYLPADVEARLIRASDNVLQPYPTPRSTRDA